MSALRPRRATEAPKPLPSDEPSRSISRAGARSSSASFWADDHMAPDEVTTLSDERSYGDPAASARSNSAIIGRQNASPTIHRCVARRSSSVAHNWPASKLRDVRVITWAPAHSPPNVSWDDVPCIIGAAGISRCPADRARRSAAMSAASAAVSGSGTLRPFHVGANTPNSDECGHITPLGMPVVPPV